MALAQPATCYSFVSLRICSLSYPPAFSCNRTAKCLYYSRMLRACFWGWPWARLAHRKCSGRQASTLPPTPLPYCLCPTLISPSELKERSYVGANFCVWMHILNTSCACYEEKETKDRLENVTLQNHNYFSLYALKLICKSHDFF